MISTLLKAYGKLSNKTFSAQAGVHSSFFDKIWTPDLYFVDAKNEKQHGLINKDAIMDIRPDGQIITSAKLTIKLHCSMYFRMFPFDGQVKS